MCIGMANGGKIPKEMTDKEIIKALGFCKDNGILGENCDKCAYYKYGALCMDTMFENALDLINRQQAEIERLNNNLSAMATTLSNSAKETGNEAIKVFWGKLKKHSRKMQSSDFSGEFWDRAVLVEDGDNLVKEMVGEGK